MKSRTATKVIILVAVILNSSCKKSTSNLVEDNAKRGKAEIRLDEFLKDSKGNCKLLNHDAIGQFGLYNDKIEDFSKFFESYKQAMIRSTELTIASAQTSKMMIQNDGMLTPESLALLVNTATSLKTTPLKEIGASDTEAEMVRRAITSSLEKCRGCLNAKPQLKDFDTVTAKMTIFGDGIRSCEIDLASAQTILKQQLEQGDVVGGDESAALNLAGPAPNQPKLSVRAQRTKNAMAKFFKGNLLASVFSAKQPIHNEAERTDVNDFLRDIDTYFDKKVQIGFRQGAQLNQSSVTRIESAPRKAAVIIKWQNLFGFKSGGPTQPASSPNMTRTFNAPRSMVTALLAEISLNLFDQVDGGTFLSKGDAALRKRFQYGNSYAAAAVFENDGVEALLRLEGDTFEVYRELPFDIGTVGDTKTRFVRMRVLFSRDNGILNMTVEEAEPVTVGSYLYFKSVAKPLPAGALKSIGAKLSWMGGLLGKLWGGGPVESVAGLDVGQKAAALITKVIEPEAEVAGTTMDAVRPPNYKPGFTPAPFPASPGSDWDIASDRTAARRNSDHAATKLRSLPPTSKNWQHAMNSLFRTVSSSSVSENKCKAAIDAIDSSPFKEAWLFKPKAMVKLGATLLENGGAGPEPQKVIDLLIQELSIKSARRAIRIQDSLDVEDLNEDIDELMQLGRAFSIKNNLSAIGLFVDKGNAPSIYEAFEALSASPLGKREVIKSIDDAWERSVRKAVLAGLIPSVYDDHGKQVQLTADQEDDAKGNLVSRLLLSGKLSDQRQWKDSIENMFTPEAVGKSISEELTSKAVEMKADEAFYLSMQK